MDRRHGEKSEIDLATYQRFELSTTAALVKYFDDNVNAAKRVLDKVSNKELDSKFELKVAGRVVMTSTKKESVQQSINHWVHHPPGTAHGLHAAERHSGPVHLWASADERAF